MNQERIFERINSVIANKNHRKIESPDLNKVKASIINYINKLVNIKKGNLLTDPESGMPDFTDYIYNYPESIRDIERSVENIIEKYEPRLENVKVAFISKNDNSFSLNFQIKGILTEEKKPLIFNSEINKTGGVHT